MPLSPGARLGAYEIIGQLGAGAMGEVYRARDTRLDRDVALKILPAEFADNPDRRRRFEQEARAAGALNHPNIVAVYDTGTQDGVTYIASELVHGESLRDLIARGPLPARRAVDIGAQIADGLSCAHAAGIVHRDLKPENIMLALPQSGSPGRAKILDFGLARYQPPAAQGTATMTQPGMVMGTVGYMSPEQVTGAPTDARSDIFSLGVILHEMLTGSIPFGRTTSVETMSAILRDDPPELPATVPPGLRQVVQHCLEKEPANRYQSAQDLAFNLRALSIAGSSIGPATALPVIAPRRRVLPYVTAALALATVALGVLFFTRPRGADLSAYRFTPFATDSEPDSQPEWSPDGKSIAYVRQVFGVPNNVMLRSLDADVPVKLADADARSLSWSADSSRLYYVTDEGVWSVSRAGGSPQEILKGNFGAAAVSPDGKAMVVWVIDDSSGKEIPKVQISSPPGAPLRKYEPVIFHSQGSFLPVYVRFAPDGRRLLLAMTTATGPQFWLLPFPDGGKPERVFASTITGGDVPTFCWEPDSRHIIVSFARRTHQEQQLWIADTKSDSLQQITATQIRMTSPSISPDGRRITYAAETYNFDLVEIPVTGGPVKSLLATSRNEVFPAWAPSGAQFAYATDRNGVPEIWIKSAQEGWTRPIVTQRDFPSDDTRGFATIAFSPDGSRISYQRSTPKHLGQLWISPISGGAPVRLTNTDDYEIGGSWSPDGNWIVYFSTAYGVVKSRLGSGEPPVHLYEHGCENPPQWSPDGKSIACSSREGLMLLSPDGKSKRKLNDVHGFVTWSRDGKTIYALAHNGAKMQFSAIDATSGKIKPISEYGAEAPFSTPQNPSMPMSVSPDGKSIATSVLNAHSDVMILDWPRR